MAAGILESQLRQEPADAQAWFLLGACRHALNDLRAAAVAFSRSIALNPANIEAHLAYVSLLRAAADAPKALAACRNAQESIPDDVRIAYATALCLEDLGQTDDALTHYDAALRIAPDFADALHNRGLLLARLGRFEDAAANQRRSIAAHPEAARAHSGLADMQLALARYEEAIETLQTLLQLDPQDASALIRRGVAYASMRRYADASRDFSDAKKCNAAAVEKYLKSVAPSSDSEFMLSPENIYLSRGWTALGQCDWSQWDEFVSEMRKVATAQDIAVEPAVAFMSRLVPFSGAERHAVAGRIAARIEARYPELPSLRPSKRDRIRVGVLSPDFREHLNAYLLLPLFELVDRERIELYAYSLAADDGSVIRARLRSQIDRFVDLQHASDQDAALAIRRDDVDILLDVGGHTTGARFAITAQRPARLQANYLGFSCSLASQRVDYALVDRFVGSDDKEWTEARIFLPHTHFLYDFRGQPAPLTVTRRDYGLPDAAFVYCAFHRAEKISPDVFELWMRVLSQVPRSVLWFRALSEPAARNLRARCAERGVDPARLAFAPFEPSHEPRYLARHRLGDLMLDSLHHNAMTSACDALGAGLPVLTLRGTALASRAGGSLVRAAGLPELVTNDQEEYVRTAVRLATDRAELRTLKRRLAASRHAAPLFDTAGRVRALEAALQGMYDRMMRGEPPASFDV